MTLTPGLEGGSGTTNLEWTASFSERDGAPLDSATGPACGVTSDFLKLP